MSFSAVALARLILGTCEYRSEGEDRGTNQRTVMKTIGVCCVTDSSWDRLVVVIRCYTRGECMRASGAEDSRRCELKCEPQPYVCRAIAVWRGSVKMRWWWFGND